jgi:hypothetical protein
MLTQLLFPDGTESPRPLSSIRTSFVAVEKDGRIGLQRSESGGSIGSRRRFSNGTEAETPPVLTDKTKLSVTPGDFGFEPRKNLAFEPIPESPRQDATAKMVDVSAPAVQTPQKDIKLNGNGVITTPGTVNGKAKVTTSGNGSIAQKDVANDLPRRPTTETKTIVATTKEPVKAAASTKAQPKVAPISTTARTVAKPSRSLAVKTPTSPNKPTTSRVARATATAATAATQAAKRAEQPKTTARTSSTSAKEAKSVPSNSLDRGVGFVKPRPKSPTRPVQLPASLMTHTASSVSKVNAQGRQSISRASGSYSTVGRSPSRTSVSTTEPTAGATNKSLKRQSSVVSRSRPSFGPPPSQPAKDFPQSKKEKDVNQDFLARMMRPTQSSSSKTHEKVPSTPPRKISNPQPVRKAAGRQPSKARSETVHRSSSPIQIPEAEPEAESESEVAEQSAAKDIAGVVEQAVTAEEAIEIAKEAEGEVELVEVEQALPTSEEQHEADLPEEVEVPDTKPNVMQGGVAETLPLDVHDETLELAESEPQDEELQDLSKSAPVVNSALDGKAEEPSVTPEVAVSHHAAKKSPAVEPTKPNAEDKPALSPSEEMKEAEEVKAD